MSLKIDPAFIQPAEHRPKPTISGAGTIPLIDLSPLLHHQIPSDSSDPAIPNEISSLIAAIGAACRDWGFFQVINHGVDPQLLERIQKAVVEFFALPAEEKRKVKRDEVNPLGYYDSENTKNVRDWKEVLDLVNREYDDGLLVLKNRWPEYPPAMRKTCEEYISVVEKLSYKLVELISLSLNLPAKRLNGFFKDSSSYFRLNYYNPCPMPDLVMGVGRHKDSGALTVLYQDQVGGLDVKRKSDGEWVRVKPTSNSYIINVGDVIEVWTNQRYESVEHRASVNSEKARLSIPFFFLPTFSTNVKPLEELVSDENPAKYEEYNWREFVSSRLGSNFKKMDKENIQISHFKKTTI
ncbi:probable 2-oxoglutarate-dependent dioxygenase At5g05600 [Dioscorea cayenensis subsp. rotundata]|uniref:Probable 2-oxoglutarate-dependent dioxygenase At5g05600 n=1 Tax=Dioscorea cayennensis subsp. rotundata TaxID=55577 RepID=A0AB40CR13_DIOCR|nr:probable 2-oxoglutarate-dependent dioxygenase At5g05600 [Dioscorea cayenensis subsp. rotundata]